FFSSRRRHTRLQGDWSSDVCSSDLHAPPVREFRETPGAQFIGGHLRAEIPESFDGIEGLLPEPVEDRAALLAAVEELLRLQDDRSEERRVGKECRCRGAA